MDRSVEGINLDYLRAPLSLILFAEVLRIEDFRIWIELLVKVNSNGRNLDLSVFCDLEAIEGEILDADPREDAGWRMQPQSFMYDHVKIRKML